MDLNCSTDGLADRSVAGSASSAGRDEVSEAREAEERPHVGAACLAEARHLDDASGQEGALRVVSQLEAVADTRGQGDDVLEGTGRPAPYPSRLV